MFQKTRQQLLLSYLGVLTAILVTFGIGVRIVFRHSLTEQVIEKLVALGQGASTNLEIEGGKLNKTDFPIQNLSIQKQGLQWFDLQGKLLDQQGNYFLDQPFSLRDSIQIQPQGNDRILAVTLSIKKGDTQQIIAYTRVSQSLADLDETLRRLDWGLGGGILGALLLSSLGGIWLTRRAMLPIEQSFERLKQFTADASHELRNPLMAIKSNVAVALKYPDGIRPGDAEKLTTVANATQQMIRLTEDLLLLAREDPPSQTHQPCDLSQILHHLIQLYQPEAQAKQIDLKADIPIKITMPGDPVQLNRLFTNLMTNAIHYTPAGGKVSIAIRREHRWVVFQIQDTGIGIGSEELDQVFDRFWRSDRSRSYWSGGSGLGLAIAQAIAHRHHGEITVTSQLGSGSCFRLFLPAQLD